MLESKVELVLLITAFLSWREYTSLQVLKTDL